MNKIELYDDGFGGGLAVEELLMKEGHNGYQVFSSRGEKLIMKFKDGSRYLVFKIDGKLYAMTERETCNLEQWITFTLVSEKQYGFLYYYFPCNNSFRSYCKKGEIN